LTKKNILSGQVIVLEGFTWLKFERSSRIKAKNGVFKMKNSTFFTHQDQKCRLQNEKWHLAASPMD
jgi:hypothetical protein